MTLHSQRYFAMEGIAEEQNGTTIAETSIRIAAFYFNGRQDRDAQEEKEKQSFRYRRTKQPWSLLAKYELSYL